MRTYNTYQVEPDRLYEIEGTTINRILQIAACLSAGDMNSLSGDEKRDLGQWLQERLRAEVGPFT
jgi:hypothetical protein